MNINIYFKRNKKEEKILQEILCAVRFDKKLLEENQVLHDELDKLLSGETIPPALKDKLNAVISKIKSNTDKLKEAVSDNTPVS
jgi:type III secretion system FlhB-like substrate exporter